MKTEAGKLQAHFFICTNKKQKGDCCADRQGIELRAQLKLRMAKYPEAQERLRVNASGCIDRCSEGVAAVLYPEGTYFTDLKLSDLDQLEQMLLSKLKTE